MVSLPEDVPGRSILFGMVPGGLPRIDEPEFDMRANRLLLLAVQNMRAELEAFVARHGADRVAVVLGASNTGIDEAQRHVDRWLDGRGRRTWSRRHAVPARRPSPPRAA